MRCRKKPVVVEAVRYSGGSFLEDVQWLAEAIENGIVYRKPDGAGVERTWVKTLEGDHLVEDGAYVIRGVKGELYPCRGDIFEMTYEEVPE